MADNRPGLYLWNRGSNLSIFQVCLCEMQIAIFPFSAFRLVFDDKGLKEKGVSYCLRT